MANSFLKTSCLFCSRKLTNSQQFLQVAENPLPIHRTSNIRHLTSHHEHRFCRSWSYGCEHGAPFKRSAVPDYGGLRHKPRESYICCCRSWLCREPALIGSYGGIGCDLHRSYRLCRGSANIYWSLRQIDDK